MDYFQLLERAYQKLPKITVKSERFEIPRPFVTYFKNRTIIENIKTIAEKINRDVEHIIKFLQKEFGVPVILEEGKAVIAKKVTEENVRKKIEEYCKTYVICPMCGKPDTKLVKKERGIIYLKCEACGAESPVPNI